MTEIQRQRQKDRHNTERKRERGERERKRGGEIQTHKYPERMLHEDDASQDNPISTNSHRETQGIESSL